MQPGTYIENIKINKRTTSTSHDNLVLMSASGKPEDTIIVANDTASDVIYVGYMKNVTIKGFTISSGKSGVSLTGSSSCTVTDNIFSNDATGVSLVSSPANAVRNNIVTKTNSDGTGRGISLDGSGNSVISNNKISNQNIGIYLGASSHRSTLSGNSVSQISGYGIQLENTDNSVLESNTVDSTTKYGIYLAYSDSNTLRSNTLSKNDNGISLWWSSGNTISSNTANLANHSIFLNSSDSNNIQSNTVSDSGYGVAMRFSNNNSVVNNNAYNDTAGFFFTFSASGNTISGNKANTNTNGFILTNGASSNTVDSNEANLNTRSGIALDNSTTTNNKISNNAISQNGRGIYLSSASGNTLLANTISSNSANGITLENTNNNNLSSNIVDSNGNYGIYLFNSNYSSVISNTAMSNKKGIYVNSSSSRDTLSKNTVSNNAEQGIMLSSSDNNTISWNTAANGLQGIALDSSTYNNVSGNTIQYNSREGLYMCARSYNNLVYNNRFNNVYNANIRNTRSSFSLEEKTRGKNIMGGPYLGGNFWGSTTGTGFSETVLNDTDGDWIVDSVYSVTNFTDRYPLLDYPDILPVASFSTNVTSGTAPLAVQFTDSSQYATGWSWDFESNGIADSTDKNPVHVYSSAGTYSATLTASNENGTVTSQPVTISVTTAGTGNETDTEGLPVASPSANVTSGYIPLTVQFTDLSQNVISRSWDIGNDGTVESTDASFVYEFGSRGTYPVKLTVSNENGTDSEVITISAQKKSSGSSGGSGGGGGAGGSPEPAKNVKVKELSQVFITSGKNVKFEFPKNATSVAYLAFDSKKTVGKTTTIVEMLKNKSTLTSDAPAGEVYNYLNIWVGNGGYGNDEDNLENAVVCFKVEKSWIQDNGVDKSSIILNRYSDKKWNELPTTLSGEDTTYLYFTAKAPGFSPFAITGKATEKEVVAGTQSETKDDKENTGSTDSEQQPVNEENATSTPEKTSSAPGFEMIYGVAGLLAVFLYKRK